MGDYDDGEITYSDNSRVVQRGTMGRSEEDMQDIEAFKTFLRSFSGEGSNSFPYRDKLRQNSKLEKKYLEVDIDDLRSYNDTLASLLISNPASYLPKFEAAATSLVRDELEIMSRRGDSIGDTGGEGGSGKNDDDDPLKTFQILLRSRDPPVSIRDLLSSQLSRLIKIHGIVVSASRIQSVPVRLLIKCYNCGHEKYINNTSSFSAPLFPHQCEGNMADITSGVTCPADPYRPVIERSTWIDRQTLKLQESPQSIPTGELPRTILLSVDRALVGAAQPGSRISVTGLYTVMQRGSKASRERTGSATIRVPYIKVVGIENEADSAGRLSHLFKPQEETEFMELARNPGIYDILTNSIAPAIYGLSDIKKAILCQLFGGSVKFLPDGVKLRGDINVLLLGDPGTAKSQLLKFVEKAAPIGVYTSGKGSSAAGLTASVTRDSQSKEFYLEGGAMVLADGGVVCIDEFDKMNPNDRVAIHEAMEQQCYDEETEVLTDFGWKKFRDVRMCDRVASLEKDTGTLCFVRPRLCVCAQYSGPMYRVSTDRVDLLVTPNHNIYARSEGSDTQFNLRRIDSVGPNEKLAFMHGGSGWVPAEAWSSDFFEVVPGKRFLAKDWAVFIALYLVDAGTTDGESVYVKDSELSRGCLNRIGVTYNVDSSSSKLTFSDPKLALYLRTFPPEKEAAVPFYIRQMPRDAIRAFVDTVISCQGSSTLKLPSKRVADDFVELLLKAGCSGHTSSPTDETVVCVEKNALSHVEAACHISRVDYTGHIYCVEVPDHVIYVRRAGCPVWCGNTISIAKAGITTILNSRAAVLAAANPVFGRYDDMKDSSENIDFQTTILSRFDMIFLIRDRRDQEYDKTVAKHVIEIHFEQGASGGAADASSYDKKNVLDISKLKRYIAYCRTKCAPRIAEDASKKLEDFFVQVRDNTRQQKKSGSTKVSKIPITVRQLEAIIRISESLAKMALSPVARVHHVEEAIRLFSASTVNALNTGAVVIGEQLSPELQAEIESAEAIIRRTLPIGSVIAENKVVRALFSEGISSVATRKAIDLMVKLGEMEYRRQKKFVYRKAPL